MAGINPCIQRLFRKFNIKPATCWRQTTFRKSIMPTLGLIVGNRGFFPAHLCQAGRRDILIALEKEGIKVIALPEEATKFGAVESLADAQKCADLFKAHREEIDGVLVTLEIWPGMVHVFQIRGLPESQEAIGRIGEFVRTNAGTRD